MSNSSFVSYTQISPNSRERTAPIRKITIHHAAMVKASLADLGGAFASASRVSSSNYGIDCDGNIGLFVEESRRAITSSSTANDNEAITIEVINSKGAPNWEVSDQALAALIDLCVDICKRNGIERLNFTGDKTGNLTQHNYFAATECPGPYLKSKFQYIADAVNKQLGVEVKPDFTLDMRILRKGCSGEDVRALQYLLHANGCPCGNADGIFGAKTGAAVEQYQRKKNLTPDQIAGAKTMGSLMGVTEV